MTYKEESYVLDTLKELQERIRAMPNEEDISLVKENNIMLKQIIKVLNYWIAHANQENENDFGRNVIANLISNSIDNRLFGRFI